MGKKGREKRLGNKYKKISTIENYWLSYLRKEYKETSQIIFDDLVKLSQR